MPIDPPYPAPPMSTLHPDKLETQKQWDADPCGAVTVQDHRPGTLEFYRAIRRHRYEVYGPWFDRVVGFDSWRDLDVLEVGVGLGSDHYRFARGGNRMTALDLSREHLSQTTTHLKLEGRSTTPHYGDAEEMPFADHSFDLVYSFGVLHHTPDTQKSIDEVLRVLRPNGTALIGLYHRHSWFYYISTMLVQGVLRGGLWRKGRRRLLSEIEYRSDPNSALPLVKVVSRRDVRKLFHGFARVRITACHVESTHFSKFAPLVSWLGRERLERWLGFGGWYLIVQAQKGSAEPVSSR
jgi:ubiquinone/menaquinone biosynthesis C-methylase UbiE